MAALIGLATARSRGEYTSAFMSLAAVPKGLNSTRSLAVPVAVKLKVSPSICVVDRVAMLVNGVVSPSESRTTCPPTPVASKRTS